MENTCTAGYSDPASEQALLFKIVGSGEGGPVDDAGDISALQGKLSSQLEAHSYPAANFCIDLRRLKRDILYRLHKFVETEGRPGAITAIELRINEPEEKSDGIVSCQDASITVVVTFSCNEHSVALPAAPLRCREGEPGVRRPFPAEVAHVYRRLEALWLRRELSSSWFD